MRRCMFQLTCHPTVGYNNQTAVCTAAAVRGTERSFPARASFFVMSVV